MTRRPRGYRTAEDVHRTLKVRAAELGIPVEELLDQILRQALGLPAATDASGTPKDRDA